MLSHDQKRTIAGKARTIKERVEMSEHDVDSFPQEHVLLEQWIDKACDGNRDSFQRRLELSGWSMADVLAAIVTEKWQEDTPLPQWIETVEELLERLRSNGLQDMSPNDSREYELPFDQIYSTFVDYAMEQVVDNSTLRPEAVSDLRSVLFKRIHSLLSPTLFIEFKVHLEARGFEDESNDRTSPREGYDDFVASMIEGGMTEFFVEYAFAAKLLVLTIENWIESTNEFIKRLESDIPDLESEFSTGKLEHVISIDLLGDTHNRGRHVLSVTFDDGAKIVYKPRPLDPAMIFDQITSWIESKAPDFADRLTFRSSPKLCYDRYGWVEWIDPEPCDNANEVSGYYQRAGELACLLYILNFTDGHLENIVSVKNYPVILDLETFAQPEGGFSAEGDQTLRSLVQNSVLRTRLLPTYSPNSDLETVGGFAAEEARVLNTQIKVPTFDYVNTDDMEMRYEHPDPLVGENLPALDGETRPPSEHLSEILSGFRRMYGFILNEREEFLSEDGPIESISATEVRYLHRATGMYEKAMYPLPSPKYLRNGFLFETQLESLFSISTMNGNEKLFELFQLEKSAMHNFDIPHCSISLTDRTLNCAGGGVTDLFEQTPLEQMKSRIGEMGVDDLNEQLDYIRLAYRPEPFYHPNPDYSNSDAYLTSSHEEALQSEVLDIYSELVQQSKRNIHGHPTWYIHENRYDGAFVHPIVEDLYGGRIGVALFTAAVASNYDIGGARKFTEEIVAPIVNKLERGEKFDDMRMGIGHGLGSLLYGFSKLHGMLGDDVYLSSADRVSNLLTTERIKEDDHFDVIDGTAGTILALLDWHDVSDGSSALDQAVAAGDHLLASRAEDGAGLWYTIQKDNYITGVAHGMSGIAIALGRLFETSGEDRFYEAYLDCTDFEQRHFEHTKRCWRDTRLRDEEKYLRRWCTGRAGGILSYFQTASIATDEMLENALIATEALDEEVLLPRDHTCCGNSGRIDAFLQVGEFLEEEGYRSRAMQLAVHTINRANKNGRYVLPWSSERWYNPTFFSGGAGVGYSFVRLLNPDLPSVLAWE